MFISKPVHHGMPTNTRDVPICRAVKFALSQAKYS
jgi:hypothetical protein